MSNIVNSITKEKLGGSTYAHLWSNIPTKNSRTSNTPTKVNKSFQQNDNTETKEIDLTGNQNNHQFANSSANQINDVIKEKLALKELKEQQNNIQLVNSEIDDVAFDVIQGKYSNYPERELLLTENGYDYNTVQSRVNEIIPIYLTALEVIKGKYSNGEERKALLTEASYDYNSVQNMVNKILGINVVHSDESNIIVNQQNNNDEVSNTIQTPVEDNIIQTPVEDNTIQTPVEDNIIQTPVEDNIIQTPVEDNTIQTSTNPTTSGLQVEDSTNLNDDGSAEQNITSIENDNSVYMEEMVNYAESYIGKGNNPLNYGYDWCLAFVNNCVRNNLAISTLKGFNLTETSCTAEVKYIKNNNPDAWHEMPGNYNGITSSTYEPKPGDIFFIENEESDRNYYVVKHTGIVSEVEKDDSGNIVSITTVEGNVNGSGNSYYQTSEVANKTYIVDEQGRYCLKSGSGTILNDFVIYGFFDTASAIGTDN